MILLQKGCNIYIVHILKIIIRKTKMPTIIDISMVVG